MSRSFRISVHFPFKQARMWASERDGHLTMDTQAKAFPAEEVARIVAVLKIAMAKDAVITVL